MKVCVYIKMYTVVSPFRRFRFQFMLTAHVFCFSRVSIFLGFGKSVYIVFKLCAIWLNNIHT